MQKVNSTHKKTKSGSKGQNDKREMCKISNGNGRNVPKAKGKRQRDKKQYKKGKKTAVVLAKQKYAGFWQSKLK